MKQFTKIRFFLLIKGNNNISFSLENEYEQFAEQLFAEGNACTDKVAYHNALVYTRVELGNLTKTSEKKCYNLYPKGH
jgi:hypothetical protein